MRKHLNFLRVGFIIILLLATTVSFIPTGSAKFFEFDSQLTMTYDSDAVNEAVFQPDGPSVSIPLNIEYQVFVPESFIGNPIMRLIILQTFIITNAKITLTVVDPPEWAAISLSNPSPYVPISTEIKDTQSTLQIAAYKEAPAQGFSLRIEAKTDPVLNGHVPEQTTYVDIQFQPGYIPLINVYTEKPNVVVAPQETVNFPIEITNLGNKETIVRARIVDYPDGWATLLPQSQIVIPSARESGDNTDTLTFSVTPPYGFGWHNELETITLEFTPEFSPPQGGGNNSAFVGTPVQFQVTLRNRGFSTPGFEFILILAAIGIILFIGRRKKFQDLY
jgi:hypothetical protein